MRHAPVRSAAILLGALLATCGPHREAPRSAGAAEALRPILVQGAMPVETERIAGRLDHVSVETSGAWKFWRGTLDGYPVVVSKTMKGLANTAAATAIAAGRYRPLAIVNQGTAGGHDSELHVGVSSSAHTPSISARLKPLVARRERAAIPWNGNRWI